MSYRIIKINKALGWNFDWSQYNKSTPHLFQKYEDRLGLTGHPIWTCSYGNHAIIILRFSPISELFSQNGCYCSQIFLDESGADVNFMMSNIVVIDTAAGLC